MIVLVVVEVLEGELAYLLALGPGSRVEEHLVVDPAEHRGDDRRSTTELTKRPEYPVETRLPDPVRLVQHDQIGDREMPVDLRVPRARRVELGCVDDLDQSPVHNPRIVAGQQHPDEFLRLGEPARLDDDDVDTGGGPGEQLQIVVQLARVDGAAQTAVAERDGGADLVEATVMASISMEPKSLTITPMRLPPLWRSRWLSRVVLPDPRKPARTRTGTGLLTMTADSSSGGAPRPERASPRRHGGGAGVSPGPAPPSVPGHTCVRTPPERAGAAAVPHSGPTGG